MLFLTEAGAKKAGLFYFRTSENLSFRPASQSGNLFLPRFLDRAVHLCQNLRMPSHERVCRVPA